MLIPVQLSFDYEGTASRECNEDGTWAETDVIQAARADSLWN